MDGNRILNRQPAHGAAPRTTVYYKGGMPDFF